MERAGAIRPFRFPAFRRSSRPQRLGPATRRNRRPPPLAWGCPGLRHPSLPFFRQPVRAPHAIVNCGGAPIGIKTVGFRIQQRMQRLSLTCRAIFGPVET
mgnify:CR=1 FL=1